MSVVKVDYLEHNFEDDLQFDNLFDRNDCRAFEWLNEYQVLSCHSKYIHIYIYIYIYIYICYYWMIMIVAIFWVKNIIYTMYHLKS